MEALSQLSYTPEYSRPRQLNGLLKNYVYLIKKHGGNSNSLFAEQGPERFRGPRRVVFHV